MRYLLITLLLVSGCATCPLPDETGKQPRREPDVRYEGTGVNNANLVPVTQLVKDSDGVWELK